MPYIRRDPQPARTKSSRYRGLSVSLLIVLSTCLNLVWAQSYEWRDVVQNVDIQRDGTVVVEDTRTLVALSGDFNEAFICLDLAPNQTLELLGGGALGPGPNARAYTQPCEDGSGGTELVVEIDDEQRVGARRVFYRYALSNTLDYYSDVVQWYWIILEQNHPPVRGYELTVTIPGAMWAPYDAYVHRFSNPEIPDVSLSDDRDELRVTFERIPDGDGVEIRYLMAALLFDQRGSEAGLVQLLQDEERFMRPSVWGRVRTWLSNAPFWVFVSPHLGLIALICGVVGMRRDYLRVRHRHDLPKPQYVFEPPSDLPPAAAAELLLIDTEYSTLKTGFSATIMDLARLGYGEFRTSSYDVPGFLGLGTSSRREFGMQLHLDQDSGALPFLEREVFDYLRAAAAHNGDYSYLDFEELQSYSRHRWPKFRSEWSDTVLSRAREQVLPSSDETPYTDDSLRAYARWKVYSGIMVGFAFLLFLASLFVVPYFTLELNEILWYLGAAVSLLGASYILNSLRERHLTVLRESVVIEMNQWRAFKRTLRDYSVMQDAPDDFFILWDRYFCYAAAFGIAERYLKNVRRALPEHGLDERRAFQQARWIGHDADSVSNAIDMSALSEAMEGVTSALQTAESESSSGGSGGGGGGGGASGGGSSGGGGGGGGGGGSGGR